MTTVAARSNTPAVVDHLKGRRRRGFAMGHGYIRFPDYVIAVTAPGGPRMPNGIETEVQVLGEEIWAGNGKLQIDDDLVVPGPVWDPRPVIRFAVGLDREWDLEPAELIGWGPGLTPLGDDIICGYFAGRVLAGWPAPEFAHNSAETTSLSRTLLEHARRGELPSPAHTLLTNGTPAELFAFGDTSGRGLLVGLAAGMGRGSRSAVSVLDIELELQIPGRRAPFTIQIRPQ